MMITQLPDPWLLLRDTDWWSLEQGTGSALELPALLASVVSGDPEQVYHGFCWALDLVSHQGTLFSAAPPVVLFTAAVLPDPRIDAVVTRTYWEGPLHPLRQVMLHFLGQVAQLISAKGREDYWSSSPPGCSYSQPYVQIRRQRPALLAAVAAWSHDPDPEVAKTAWWATRQLLAPAPGWGAPGPDPYDLASQGSDIQDPNACEPTDHDPTNRDPAQAPLPAAWPRLPGWFTACPACTELLAELQAELGAAQQSGFSDESIPHSQAATRADLALGHHLVDTHANHLPGLDIQGHGGCVGCFEWTVRAVGGMAIPGQDLYEEYLHRARHVYAPTPEPQ
ncbi:hypothetical protein [Actinomadura kijaniata]|uniref:hypothetical protein n=1 Tax=Actinomadura kijaniata TaxID=46161 RepID=UPI00083784FF|nr:hypothetical protein [Actinomadura kijaniata]